MIDAATERFHENVKAISDSIDQRDRVISELYEALEAARCALHGILLDRADAALAKARDEQVSV